MGRSWTIGRMFGVPVRLHWTLLLLAGPLLLSVLVNPAAALPMVAVFAGVFASVTAHEFGHILVARRFGGQAVDVILSPLGGAARMRRMPERPKHEILVALAGPAVNLVIVGVVLAILGEVGPVLAVLEEIGGRYLGEAPSARAQALDFAGALALVGAANLAIGVFNLLPGFPMDGGRVLRAALVPSLGYRSATRLAVNVGRVVMLGLIAWGATLLTGEGGGGFVGVLLIAIGVMLSLAGTAEWVDVQRRDALRKLTVADAMERAYQLGPTATLGQVRDLVHDPKVGHVVVTDRDGALLGFFTQDIVAGYSPMDDGAPLAERALPQENVPWVRADAELNGVLDGMAEGQLRAVPVVGADDRVAGVLTFGGVLSTWKAQMIVMRNRKETPAADAPLGRPGLKL